MQTTEPPYEIILIDRITTESGSVYEFVWDEPDWPENGPRFGRSRKAGGRWEFIQMVTPGFEIGSRMFWIREDSYTVHTSRIAAVESVVS